MIVNYEELMRNPIENILKIIDFWNIGIDKDIIGDLVDRFTFEFMETIKSKLDYRWISFRKHNVPTTRRGTTGDGALQLNQQQMERLTQRCREYGLEFLLEE
jgi:hypothetical protein